MFAGDGDFVVLVGKREGDLFEDVRGQGLCAEFGFDGNPGALKGFGVGRVIGGEGSKGGERNESDAKEFLHDLSFGLVSAMKSRRSDCVKSSLPSRCNHAASGPNFTGELLKQLIPSLDGSHTPLKRGVNESGTYGRVAEARC